MTSSQASSPVISGIGSPVNRSRSSTTTKAADDVTSLTSFNFLQEDEDDQSSYAIVTSLLSRVKNSFIPLASSPASPSAVGSNGTNNTMGQEARRPSHTLTQQSSFSSKHSGSERPHPFATVTSNPAPPLVSLTPAQSELPTYSADYDRSPSRNGMFYSPSYESSGDGGIFGTSIPGFPIQDDARSIKTSGSLHRSGSVSKVIRRIRGEGACCIIREVSSTKAVQGFQGIIGWTMRTVGSATTARVYSQRGDGSIIVGSVVWLPSFYAYASHALPGQIFCSRCASNIIKGSRFGHDGMVRVCNLCLEKLAKVDDEDDDDRRSIISTATSFPAHQLGAEMGLAHHPQSPFAASQLFGRTDEPFNLYSIAETKRPISGSDDSLFGSRPITPRLRERDDGIWEVTGENVVPFRRALADEEAVDLFDSDGSPNGHPMRAPIDFPMMIDDNGTKSSIQFPMGSPEHGESPGDRLRSRFNSYAEFDAATPFIRSRVPSRLDNFAPAVEPGWRTRRESTAYATNTCPTASI